MDIVPVLGYAVFPCYNVRDRPFTPQVTLALQLVHTTLPCCRTIVTQIPALRYTELSLNLTLEIWAEIYLNHITTWSHPSIVAINPAFASILTALTTDIIVMLGTDSSPLTRMVTTVLSDASPDFNSTVGVVATPDTYPVADVVNRTVPVAGAESALAGKMNDLSYTFAALSSGQLATAKNVRMAALYNPTTGNYVVPSTASIQSAMRDHDNESLIHLFLGARNCTFPPSLAASNPVLNNGSAHYHIQRRAQTATRW